MIRNRNIKSWSFNPQKFNNIVFYRRYTKLIWTVFGRLPVNNHFKRNTQDLCNNMWSNIEIGFWTYHHQKHVLKGVITVKLNSMVCQLSLPSGNSVVTIFSTYRFLWRRGCLFFFYFGEMSKFTPSADCRSGQQTSYSSTIHSITRKAAS